MFTEKTRNHTGKDGHVTSRLTPNRTLTFSSQPEPTKFPGNVKMFDVDSRMGTPIE